MSAEGQDTNSAITTSLSITFGIILVPAVIWFISTSIGYKKFNNDNYSRFKFHVLIAILSSALWTAVVYVITLPNLGQGGFGDLVIIIVGLFSAVFAIISVTISTLLYKLGKAKLFKKS